MQGNCPTHCAITLEVDLYSLIICVWFISLSSMSFVFFAHTLLLCSSVVFHWLFLGLFLQSLGVTPSSVHESCQGSNLESLPCPSSSIHPKMVSTFCTMDNASMNMEHILAYVREGQLAILNDAQVLCLSLCSGTICEAWGFKLDCS